MAMTEPVDWIGKPVLGYAVSARFGDSNRKILAELISQIELAFPGTTFSAPSASLHITLLDWVAPLVNYNGQDKDGLYRQVKADYTKAIKNILAGFGPISVRFTEIRVVPSGIIIVGQDGGQFGDIRRQFNQRVEVLTGTKPPPEIVHSTLARFTVVTEIEPYVDFIRGKSIDMPQVVDEFVLTRSLMEPMLDYEIVQRFSLG